MTEFRAAIVKDCGNVEGESLLVLLGLVKKGK